MNIDWNRAADPESFGETASVLISPRPAAATESVLESMAPAVGVAERERLERLEQALAAAAPRLLADKKEEVKRRVMDGARSGLAKLGNREPASQFTVAEHVGLEAVIFTNGERPSLIIKDGFVDLGAPNIGTWAAKLRRFEPKIRAVIKSVGRIDVPVDPWFKGTCLAVAPGVVLTNRHVLEEIATQDGARNWVLKWPDATFVDFMVEDGGPGHGGLKVTGVVFAGADPINRTIDFTHLDAALLQVEPTGAGATFPDCVTFETDLTRPQNGAETYVLGFPAEPNQWVFGGTPPAGYETTQVLSTLFNGDFGIKRLAPGQITFGPGELPNDPKQWICGHDASTLAGNSGSCIVDLAEDGFRALGLHFGGLNRKQNWGHTAARLQDPLAASQARFV